MYRLHRANYSFVLWDPVPLINVESSQYVAVLSYDLRIGAVTDFERNTVLSSFVESII